MADLVLYGDDGWISPWVFHALVALEEKRLPYRLELVPLPIPDAVRALLRQNAILGKVPALVHNDVWVTESLAISEYLAERFPAPDHPRLFPADLGERARARQVMSMLRTGLFALREDRPTDSVFGKRVLKPLSAKGAADASELLRVAGALVKPGATSMFAAAWCIADADLSLALMRLVANGDDVPAHLAAYARATWARPSVQVYLAKAAAASR
jgi:glutathione S-transferase